MHVLVCGTFDLLHPGHLFLLSEARKRGRLHVIIARDATAQHIKRQWPVQSEEERKRAIEIAFPDAHVVLGDPQGDFLRPVQEIRPDLLILGYDQRLPPGIREEDLPCPTERLPAFHPEEHKSSVRRQHHLPPHQGRGSASP